MVSLHAFLETYTYIYINKFNLLNMFGRGVQVCKQVGILKSTDLCLIDQGNML